MGSFLSNLYSTQFFIECDMIPLPSNTFSVNPGGKNEIVLHLARILQLVVPLWPTTLTPCAFARGCLLHTSGPVYSRSHIWLHSLRLNHSGDSEPVQKFSLSCPNATLSSYTYDFLAWIRRHSVIRAFPYKSWCPRYGGIICTTTPGTKTSVKHPVNSVPATE